MTGSTSQNSDACVVHGNRVFRQYGVTKRRNGLLAKNFSRVFSSLTSRLKSYTKYQGKRHAGRKRSGRCTTTYHEGWLRRNGVGQCVQGQGAFHLCVKTSQCCLAGRYVRFSFARGRGQSSALDDRGICVLGVVGDKNS